MAQTAPEAFGRRSECHNPAMKLSDRQGNGDSGKLRSAHGVPLGRHTFEKLQRLYRNAGNCIWDVVSDGINGFPLSVQIMDSE
jgi:hypothetical protein